MEIYAILENSDDDSERYVSLNLLVSLTVEFFMQIVSQIYG